MQSQSNQSKSSQSWWSSTSTWMKKQYFNSTHMIDLAWNNNKSDQVWLFGKRFQSNQQARIIYSTVLWFTYRQNLHFQSNQSITNDIGWGCMLRVGQMMIAQVIRLSMGLQCYCDLKTINHIIREVVSQKGNYSIQKIVEVGYKLYEKKAGQWYSPSHIAFILQQIQAKIKNTQLGIVVFDNEFQLNRCLQTLKKIESQNRSLLIIILFRIGYTTAQQNLLQQVIKILKEQERCVGILGGRPGKAHYLIGSTNKQFIYLDPHCVKEGIKQQQFFNEKIFSVEHNKIDPSMGICFHVKNSAELLLLHERFQLRKSEVPFYSYSEGNTPQIVIDNERTMEFQILD